MQRPRQIWGGLGNQMFQFAYIFAQYKKGKIPDFYLQSEEYFKKYRKDIRQLYGRGIEEQITPYVSIHIRRGDYVNNPFYVDLTQTDYYDKALEYFKGSTFLIFCADRQEGSNDGEDKLWCYDWAKKKGINYLVWNGKNEIEDMNAMAGCEAHIMANSSFSWWASYLGGGTTIAPKQWFTDGVERVKLLDDWIKI